MIYTSYFEKPTIHVVKGTEMSVWRCKNTVRDIRNNWAINCAWGDTPKKAFDNWLKKSEVSYEPT